MKKNPFITGNRVPPSQFINRTKEIKDAVSLLLSGQSLAFTGDPRSGKTSLLLYLQEPDLQKKLYDGDAECLYFFYLDFQPIGYDFTYSQFWQLAIQSFVTTIRKKSSKSQLPSMYKSCEKNNFKTYSLEDFFKQVGKEGWHLVLLLDEFDTLLYHPVLNSNEFFGGLRSLASRFGHALTLALSSQSTLSLLNDETKKSSPNGSAYFNFIKEIPVLPFKNEHARQILSQSRRRFNDHENEYLLDLAGCHAYLLQSAGSALWSAYENKYSPHERLVIAGQEVLRTASDSLERIWQTWTPKIRKVFTTIALDEMPTLLGEYSFDIESMRKSMQGNSRDIRYLHQRGFIVEDKQLPSGYCVTSKVMLWWLAEELLITLEKKDELGQFLYKNQLDGLFTKGEQLQFSTAISNLKAIAVTGAETFVKSAAEGFGKGISTKPI